MDKKNTHGKTIIMENKYRGKATGTPSFWIHGYLFEHIWAKGHLSYILAGGQVPSLSMPSREFAEVIPETVGQFTGYSMGVKEVYISDTVSNNQGTSKEVVREIVIHNGCMMMKRISGKSKLPKYISLHKYHELGYEVIGNIHDK